MDLQFQELPRSLRWCNSSCYQSPCQGKIGETVASLAICHQLRTDSIAVLEQIHFPASCDLLPCSSVETFRCSTMLTQPSGLAKGTPKARSHENPPSLLQGPLSPSSPLPPCHSNLLSHRTDATAHLWRSEQLRQISSSPPSSCNGSSETQKKSLG